MKVVDEIEHKKTKNRQTNKQRNKDKRVSGDRSQDSKYRQVLPIQLELQLAQVDLYTRKDFKSLEIGSLYEK